MSDGGSVTIRAILDASEVTRGMADIRKSVKGLKDDAERGFGAVEDASKDAAEGMGDMADAARDAEAPVDKLGGTSGDTGQKARKMGEDAERAGQKARKMGDEVKKAHADVQGLGQGMQTVGSSLTKAITLPVLAVGTASVAASIDIDTSLTNVKKTVDGTAEDYARLKEAAIEYSKVNAVSASEMLDMQSLGAQLGFNIDELEEFGRVSSGLEISTNMGAEQASMEMAQFANITGMAHDEISNYGSTIVALGNNLATTESDVSSMAMRVAAAGRQVGMSEAEILGFSAAMTSMGIEAEAGGTAISTVMSSIDATVARSMQDMSGMTEKEAKKVNTALETWASTANMSAEEFQEAWSSDPASALGAVLSGMDAAVEEGGNMTLMLDELGITSIRQTDMLKRLAGNSEKVGEALGIANTAWEENTALQNEVDNRNESLAAKFEMVKNRAIAMADDIGGPVADALLDVVDRAEPLIQALSDGSKAFADMSSEEQEAVLQAVALSAAVGPVLNIFGNGVEKAARFGKSAQNLARYLNDVGGAGSAAAKGAGNAGKAAKGAEAGLRASSVAAGALKTALKGIGIGLAVAALAALATEIKAAIDYQGDLQRVTEGLADSHSKLHAQADKAAGAFGSAGDGAEGYKGTLDDLRGELREFMSEQADMYDAIDRIYSDAGLDSSKLQGYYDTIDALLGKTDLTAREQAELAEAIQGVNEMTGESFELAQNDEGCYVALKDGAEAAKDEVLKLIQAQQLQVKMEANKGAMAELAEEEGKSAEEVKKAYDVVQQARERLANWKPDDGARAWENDDAKKALQADVDEAQAYYDQMVEAHREYEASMRQVQDESLLYASAMDKGVDSIEGFVASSSLLMTSFDDTGVSAMDFAACLVDAGASAEGLAGLSEEQLLRLAGAYDGTLSSIAWMLTEYGVEWDEAASESVLAMEKSAEQAGVMTSAVQDALASAGQTTPDFIQALSDAGVSAEELASMTQSQMALVASAFDGSAASVQGSLAAIRGVSAEEMASMASEMGDGGQAAVDAYNAALDAGAQPAESSAQRVAQSANGGFEAVDATSSGEHWSAGIANGMQSGMGRIISLATQAASAAKKAYDAAAGIHSPSREMAKSGRFWVQGIAVGMDGENPALMRRTAQLATSMNERFGRTLGSAADDIAADYISHLSGRIEHYAGQSDGMANAGDYIWGTLYAQTKAQGFHRVGTGGVYRSMQRIEEAGYKDLDDFIEQGEKYREKLKDYADKLEDYRLEEKDWKKRLKEKKVSDSTKRSYEKWKRNYAEWKQEYADYKKEAKEYEALKNSLEAGEATIREWLPLYNVKKDLNQSLDEAISWSTSFGKLASKTGVVFSQNFIERISKGGEDAMLALEKMRGMSASQIQSLVDSYDDLERAEREQQINARSLYVNSLKYLNMRKPADWMNDFRETCLDVKAAIYSDGGLSECFESLGVSVEEFALGLRSTETTMDDFLGYYNKWVESVGDGFKGLSRDNQTGLDEWRHTIENNIIESVHWADNLENVFGKIGGVSAEAFEEAVRSGGFEVWGRVIAELANGSSYDAQQAADLYYHALKTGMETGTQAFMSMSNPGAELSKATQGGIESGRAGVVESMQGTMSETYLKAMDSAKSYAEIGFQIDKNIADSVLANGGLISTAVARVSARAKGKSSGASGASMAGVGGASAASFAPMVASVDWYATGGIFDRAEIIGVGESGPEAVVPLSGPSMAPFASAIAESLEGAAANVSTVINNYNDIRDAASAERLARRSGVYVDRAARKIGRSRA